MVSDVGWLLRLAYGGGRRIHCDIAIIGIAAELWFEMSGSREITALHL